MRAVIALTAPANGRMAFDGDERFDWMKAV
jgi:hypothetical protein